MNVLGIIGSARRLGNGEVLVKEALTAAQAEGATVRAIRLPDYRLLPCKGCLACVLKGDPCRLDDDMHALWEQLQWADGFIISAPTYFLGPAGIVKLLIDRLFEYSLALGQARRRPAALMLTAGLREWDPFSLPTLTMLAGVLQLDVLGKLTAYRPGPAEVLLDEDTMRLAADLGRRVAKNQPSAKPSAPKAKQTGTACPQCGNSLIQVVKGNVVECALCQAQGQLLVDGKTVTIKWGLGAGKNRWSAEALAKHFSEWVLQTGPAFQKHRDRVEAMKQRYRALPVEPGPTR
jgi:NAD(P)H-dependent FMN reductase